MFTVNEHQYKSCNVREDHPTSAKNILLSKNEYKKDNKKPIWPLVATIKHTGILYQQE